MSAPLRPQTPLTFRDYTYYTPEIDPLNQEPTPQAYLPDSLAYFHLDHLGTPIEMTDRTGKTVWEATYQAWGEVETVSGSMKQPFRFQGQYFDEESGLHYNRFRYYDPSSGRFVSQDQIGLLGGVNLYEYVADPLQWLDPLGLAKGKNRQANPAKECPTCSEQQSCGSGKGQKNWTRIYEENSGKHKVNGYWQNKKWISPRPTNGALILNNTSVVPFREKGLVGYDKAHEEVIQFNRHRIDEQNCIEYWHGFVVNNQPVPMNPAVKSIAQSLGYKGKK